MYVVVTDACESALVSAAFRASNFVAVPARGNFDFVSSPPVNVRIHTSIVCS